MGFRFLFLTFITVWYLNSGLAAQTIIMHQLKTAPVLDGSGEDWRDIKPVIVPLKKTYSNGTVQTRSVSIKGGTFDKRVYFYLEWHDTTRDDFLHKPYVWSPKEKKYVRGPQREDRLALQFAISGDYTTDWFSGKSFKADMWHWKASRSNPLGLAHDKLTRISTTKLVRAYKGRNAAGTTIYIQRSSDSGEPIYHTKRYWKKQKDIMPKYILNPHVSGSVADIKAAGDWSDNYWHLELSRKLNTGHLDDVRFKKGKTTKGGIAVFDHSENQDHAISDTLTFQF